MEKLASKYLFGLAFACLIAGIVNASAASAGSDPSLMTVALIALVPVLIVFGSMLSFAPTRKCVHCGERNKKDAVVCQRCRRMPKAYRRLNQGH